MTAGLFDRPDPAPRPVWCAGARDRPPHTTTDYRRLPGGVLLCPTCQQARDRQQEHDR